MTIYHWQFIQFRRERIVKEQVLCNVEKANFETFSSLYDILDKLKNEAHVSYRWWASGLRERGFIYLCPRILLKFLRDHRIKIRMEAKHLGTLLGRWWARSVSFLVSPSNDSSQINRSSFSFHLPAPNSFLFQKNAIYTKQTRYSWVIILRLHTFTSHIIHLCHR